MRPIGVLGDGAWGTALATVLANNGHAVLLWCYQEAVAHDIKESRINNRYLPGVQLDELIVPVTDMSKAVSDVSYVFCAIPVQFMRTCLQQAQPHAHRNIPWVVLSKGIEQNTFKLPSQIIDDTLGASFAQAVVAGPNFATELARKKLSATVIAAPDCSVAQSIQTLLANNYFRPYVSLDMVGAQVGGALKNLIALVIGMLDGADFDQNAKAFILTRGLHEMALLTEHLGGQRQTMYGLSGVGDLVLTAMGGLSKNMQVGQRLGKGQKLDAILQQTGFIPEGINTMQAVHQYLRSHDLDLPICALAYQVIFEGMSVNEMMQGLMARPFEQECDF